VTIGAMESFGKSALFVQASSMPTKNNFLINRSNYTFVLQAGLRHNFGSSIGANP
jgi:hypothetical protein